MSKNDRQYEKIVNKNSPKSPVFKNCTFAFLIGGTICTIGQMYMSLLMKYGIDKEQAAAWVSVVLIFTSALFTGIGVYDDIARLAGGGTLVPITGFANAVVSPALEYKTEGMITGTSAKMFIIAGPVIVYGVLSAWACGVIKWIGMVIGV